MEQDELLRIVTQALGAQGLRYLVTGSMATIYYGEPRFTADIDVVVDLPAEKVRDLCQAFPSPEFYVSEESAQRATRHKSQFNIVHPRSGLKVDLMVSDRSAFDRSRFDRVRWLRPEEDYEASFASPEDVILKKMEYFREGGSEKHLRDIDGILRISGESLDAGYIDRWAETLGVGEIWEQIRKSSQ